MRWARQAGRFTAAFVPRAVPRRCLLIILPALSTNTASCNHPLHRVPRCCHHPEKKALGTRPSSSLPGPPWPCLHWMSHTDRIVRHATSRVWLLSLSATFASTCQDFVLFQGRLLFHCREKPHSVHPFISDGPLGCSWLLRTELLGTRADETASESPFPALWGSAQGWNCRVM